MILLIIKLYIFYNHIFYLGTTSPLSC